MSQDTTIEKLTKFDWDAYSADCPTNFRKPNPHIKAPSGVKIYSRDAYAQELFNIMDRFESGKEPIYNINIGETLEGTVYSVDQGWASIDIGYREMVYVDMSRESHESKSKLVPGNKLSVEITGDQKSNSRGFIIGSIEAGIKAALFREMLQVTEDRKTAYSGTVTGMIPNGGYFINIQGIDCFMPGSLAGINKLADFESILNTQIYVVPMSYSTEKGTIIVSHRKYLQALIPGKIEELKNTIGDLKTGNVTGSAKYGVFVEFDGCLTGMIHVNDLSPEFAKRHKVREIQPGEEINFFVKEIISDSKITLTQLEYVESIDPWQEILTRYKSFPTETQGTIKSVKDYGVFVDVGEGIVGLLHVSELPDGISVESFTKNDSITVQITRIDAEARKVFLKL
jgi:ribosomal protein S1